MSSAFKLRKMFPLCRNSIFRKQCNNLRFFGKRSFSSIKYSSLLTGYRPSLNQIRSFSNSVGKEGSEKAVFGFDVDNPGREAWRCEDITRAPIGEGVGVMFEKETDDPRIDHTYEGITPLPYQILDDKGTDILKIGDEEIVIGHPAFTLEWVLPSPAPEHIWMEPPIIKENPEDWNLDELH